MRACMWGRCNGEVPDTGGACNRCGKVTQFRSKPATFEPRQSSMTHELKTWKDPFKAVLEGRKHHELRKFDRDYQVGDFLILREWDPEHYDVDPNEGPRIGGYTGNQLKVRVTYVSKPGTWGLPNDLGVMSIVRLPPDDF